MKKQGIAAAISDALNDFFIIQKDINKVTGLYRTVVLEVETALIKQTYKLTGRNKKQTAKILGISRNTLTAKMKILGIKDAKLI
ncbi:MAG: hypothetical protein LBU35_02255 [Holosporales bacterium]|jgi:DNA-binding protein Fis|nr:hypothetical protein [Holosporales bacterium]